VRSLDLQLAPGELVGLAGLIGAGRTEAAEAIVGLRPHGGSIQVEGRPVSFRNPEEAKRAGVVYLSEDRKALGLHLSMSSKHNITLANLRAYARPIVDRKQEERAVAKWTEALGIKIGDPDAPVLNLSGGNQQKVALAKWLDTQPKVLILDEPTRGVDVGAKREIYNLIHQLARQGMACLLISSEMTELIGLCHRVLVMRSGTVEGELSGDELTEEAIMRLAAGVAA
jgi:ribose transport system ATP-binding protein